MNQAKLGWWNMIPFGQVYWSFFLLTRILANSYYIIVGLDWWFGIGVHPSNNPFHKGILGIQTTGPQANN